MSLNKFKSDDGFTNGTLKGRVLNLEIGCSKLHVKDEAKIDTLDGGTYNLVTPDVGTADKVLTSDGAGSTFWSTKAGGAVTGIVYDGTPIAELNRLLKTSSTDGSTADQSVIIEDGGDAYIGPINVNNKIIKQGDVNPITGDLTDLQTKTQNITLSTVAGETFIEGKINYGIAPNNFISPNSSSGAVTGDMLTFNSVTKELDWEQPTNGTVTQIDAGTGLTPNSITNTGTLHIADTGVVLGNYTNANISVNAQGQITTASNGTAGTLTNIETGTGLVGGPITNSGTIDLEDTAVVAGNYLHADITIDQQGRITSASNGAIPSLTDLESKTQNISLANTVPNQTDIVGNVEADSFTQNGTPVLIESLINNSTGLIQGGKITQNTPTTVNVSAGTGVINYAAGNGITNVPFGAFTSGVLTAAVNFIYVDDLGQVFVTPVTPPTNENIRKYIFLGVVAVDNLVIVDILNLPCVLENPEQNLYDLAVAIGNFNTSGNVFTFNGANLFINKNFGSIYEIGANYQTDRYNPSNVSQLALSGSPTFTYSAQQPAGVQPSTTVADPNNYDLNGVISAIGGGVGEDKFTIQRIYMTVNNKFRLEYGQNIYDSLLEAEDNISIETHVQSVSPGLLLRGFLIIKKGTTDLSNTTENIFLEASKFGGSHISGGSSSTTTLQIAYNNSFQPQIETSILGAVQIKEGQNDDQLPVFEILDNADTINTTLRADGAISCKNELLLTHTATELGDHSLEIIHDTGLFPDSKAIDIDYITSVAPLQNEDVILINIDKSNTTGGEVEGIIVVATEGSAQCTALEVGVGCNPLLHEKGSFTDPTTGIDINGILTPLGSLSGSTLFVADNDFIIIADANPFEEIEFLLSVVASQGINPTFEFSTGVTPTWNSFSPVDGTNGLQNTGVIIWSAVDTPLWDNASGLYKIRMTRTRNNVNTSPIAQDNGIRIAQVEEFYWNKDASVKMFDLQVNDTVTVGISPNNYVFPNTSLGASNGDVLVYNSATKDMEFSAQTGGGGVSNLSLGTPTITTLDIDNDNGTGVQLPSATNALAGLMSRDKFNEVVVNNGKVSNVTTDLTIGTHNSTNIDINSSDGLNVTIPSATNSLSGIMTSTNFNNITTNNAKVSNVTHTSEVTGSTALTVNEIVITNKNPVTATSNDTLLIVDDADGLFKSVTAQSIADLGGGGVSALSNGGTTSLVSNSNGILKGLVAGSNITFNPVTSTDVTINSSITGSGAIRSAYTTSFYHGGALNNVNVNYLGYGTGVVNTPTTAYNQLLPAQLGFDSVLNHVGMTIGGFYTAVAPTDKTVTVRTWVYNTTTSPILTATITPTAALPNAANWVLVQTTVLNFGQDGVGHYYRSEKANYVGNSNIGTLVGGSANDEYICTLSIQQNNVGVNSLPDLIVNLDWDVPI